MGGRVHSPTFVGRIEELQALEAARRRAADGEPAVVLVGGEAGIGKTRLVAELLGAVGEVGAVALSGGCLNVGEGVLAYAPMVEALRPLAGAMDPKELERVLGGTGAELARLVPELGPQAGGEQAAPLAPDAAVRAAARDAAPPGRARPSAACRGGPALGGPVHP
jgi:predicted ATPase